MSIGGLINSYVSKNEMTLQEYFQKIDEIYDEGRTIKDRVRQSQRNYELNLEASKKMELAVNLIQEVLKLDLKNEETVYSLKIDREYYSYEKYDCLSHYYYESHKIDEAVENIHKGLSHLKDSIALLKSIPTSFSDKFKTEYGSRIKRWEYFYNNSTNKIYTFFARKALDNNNFIEALDNYKRFAREAKSIIEQAKELEPMYERVSIGNYVGMLANISQTMAQITLENETINNGLLPSNAAIVLLNYGLDAYLLAKEAGEQNPEWDQYKDLVRVTYNNLKNFLLENKRAWLKIYIHFQDQQDLLKIMQTIDYKEFNKVKSEILGENQTFKLWKFGSFFILLFLIIFLVVFTFVLSKISILYFILSLVGIQVLFVIISITILRSINLLSEKGFVELTKFVLLNEFKLFITNRAKMKSET